MTGPGASARYGTEPFDAVACPCGTTAQFDKNGFRNEVIKVYQSLRPLTDKYIRDNVIRGQYIMVMTVSVIVKKRMFVLIPVQIPTWRCVCMWITGVGRECLLYPYRKADAYQGDRNCGSFQTCPMQMFPNEGRGFTKVRNWLSVFNPTRNSSAHSHEEPGAGFYMGTMEMDFSLTSTIRKRGCVCTPVGRQSGGWSYTFTVPMPWTRAGLTLIRFWIIGRSIQKLSLWVSCRNMGTERSGCIDQPQSFRMDKPVQESDTFQFIL